MTEMNPISSDPAMLRRVYSCFPTGVTAVCGLVDQDPVGMAVSAFTPVSLEPALVSVCVQNTSTTWPRLRRLHRVGVSVLAETHDATCRTLSLKEGDRFAGVRWAATPTGGIVVQDATACLECSVYSEIPAGDHSVVLLRIHELHAEPHRAPLVFHGSRFHKLAASHG